MDNETSPPPGHNAPPPPNPPTPEQIEAWLQFQTEALVARRDNVVLPAIAAMVEAHPTIGDGDAQVAASFTDNLALAAALSKAVETEREKLKRPFLEGGRVIDRWSKQYNEVVLTGTSKAKDILLSYHRRRAELDRIAREEAARKAREEADRKAAEAAEAMQRETEAAKVAAALDAATKAAEQADDMAHEADAKASLRLEPTRGMLGPSSGLRTTWTAKIIDPALVPDEYKVIEMARINAKRSPRDPNSGRPLTNIPGVEWVPVEDLNIRR